jgi:protein-S-isoprenylcysteine O-methyltransferase Ste14
MWTVVAVLAFLVLAGAVLFTAAGRLDLPFFWAVLTVSGVFMLAMMASLDPELRRERFKPARGGVSRSFRPMMLPIVLGHWALAGLDVGRFHWSDTVPLAVGSMAIVGLALSMALAMWAMRANRFFSPVVRIQTERGHHVVTSGPYRFVRHPGYVASVLAFLFGALALGSWLAAALVVPYAGLFLYRTLLEERYLRENLSGYTEYTNAVRYRWLPGVW